MEGLEWAAETAAKVNQITSLNVGVWTPTLSPALGTLSFGCQVESLGDLEDAEAKLVADPMYLELVQRSAELSTGTYDDQVAQYVHDAGGDPAATHCSVVIAQIANGRFQRGAEVGVEIAQRATEIGGVPTSFLLATTGLYGACIWISAATSLRELERGEQTVNANESFLKLVDDNTADCYVQGSASQSIWRKVG
jgi:hypothetical protein